MNLKARHKEYPEFDVTAQDAIMDAFIEAIIVMDTDGSIERFNEAAENMFGYTAGEAIGQDISILMPDPDRSNHHRYVERYLATREARIIGIGREMTARRKDGTMFPMHLAVGEVGWHGKVSFIGLIRNLTDDKLAEERRLRQHTDMITASRLATMGEMAAAMAHEINQPLAAIANYASAAERLLNAGPENTEDVQGALASVKTQAHRAGEIIRTLRSFVKPQVASLEVQDLKSVVEDIRSLAELDARANNIQLTIDVASGLPEIIADGLQIQQVILNLLRNGIDAMLDCGPDDRRLELHGYISSPEEVRVDVIDRGHGIPQAVRDSLFNPFFTTKTSGMGMGLAISQTIVKSHGGKLGFEDNPGGGTTFYVTLPTKVA
ncbi:MAG: PAS domain S-box protein [Gammaproteobacteria bacterium]|nr:PAS domain S-box protein [Gammaproteobacteria bacterium]NND37487.1 PAS domain S-box protein [Gammaproteobacteria bacterium]